MSAGPGAQPAGAWEPAPGPVDDSVSAFTAQVAQASRDRAGSWDAVAEVLTMDEEAVARLRAGDQAALWRAGARWLGDDAQIFVGDLLNLDVYARGAERRGLDADVAALARDHATLVAPDAAVVEHVRRVADLCREEADAWARGDLAGGKALRAREREVIDAHLVPVLPALGGRLAQGAEAKISRTLGRLVLAVLSVESGKDYQRAVLGE
ncbi:hypothetical protein [Georgenia sp. SYP-B2076]|uniref:hypothetical protein n=1 Tax=Georgenia sp. SYP-B2076 TaxID=2495881 RepID=UPI000F8EBF4C|nr:hypothetical protein [Georgenia sp. SYP-B2076]